MFSPLHKNKKKKKKTLTTYYYLSTYFYVQYVLITITHNLIERGMLKSRPFVYFLSHIPLKSSTVHFL